MLRFWWTIPNVCYFPARYGPRGEEGPKTRGIPDPGALGDLEAYLGFGGSEQGQCEDNIAFGGGTEGLVGCEGGVYSDRSPPSSVLNTGGSVSSQLGSPAATAAANKPRGESPSCLYCVHCLYAGVLNNLGFKQWGIQSGGGRGGAVKVSIYHERWEESWVQVPFCWISSYHMVVGISLHLRQSTNLLCWMEIPSLMGKVDLEAGPCQYFAIHSYVTWLRLSHRLKGNVQKVDIWEPKYVFRRR